METSFYFLERDYKEGDIMIPFEYQGSLEIIYAEKKTTLNTIHYIGENDTDYLTSGVNVVSEKFKNFIDEIEIEGLVFLPIEIEKEGKKIDAFILKFLNSEDCIDYEKSDLVEIQGLIRKIKNLKIKEDFNKMFFQIKGLKLRIVVNDLMKSKIEKSNLKGLKFSNLS